MLRAWFAPMRGVVILLQVVVEVEFLDILVALNCCGFVCRDSLHFKSIHHHGRSMRNPFNRNQRLRRNS